MKQYSDVLRLTALLLVFALTGPSVAALACEVACAADRQASTQQGSTTCHDEGDDSSSSPAFSTGHACHDVGSTPVLISRSIPPLSTVFDAAPSALAAPDVPTGGRHTAPLRRQKPDDRPPLTLPLRI